MESEARSLHWADSATVSELPPDLVSSVTQAVSGVLAFQRILASAALDNRPVIAADPTAAVNCVISGAGNVVHLGISPDWLRRTSGARLDAAVDLAIRAAELNQLAPMLRAVAGHPRTLAEIPITDGEVSEAVRVWADAAPPLRPDPSPGRSVADLIGKLDSAIAALDACEHSGPQTPESDPADAPEPSAQHPVAFIRAYGRKITACKINQAWAERTPVPQLQARINSALRAPQPQKEH